MSSIRNLIGVAVIGVVGIVIVMAVVLGSNTTGWNGTTTMFVSTIIPIVMGAGVLLLILASSMGKKD